MNPIDYYKNSFAHDLTIAQNIDPNHSDRISIVSLLPDKATCFDSMNSPYLFLFCFFFSAILDQAVHSGLREEHEYFANLARYPKIVGILAMYWHNIHPVTLLMAATFQISPDQKDDVTKEFETLSDYFIDDYCNFFIEQYPKLSGRLQKRDDQIRACSAILNEMSTALAILFCPKTIKPYSSKEADQELVEKWVSHFRDNVNNKIAYLDKNEE